MSLRELYATHFPMALWLGTLRSEKMWVWTSSNWGKHKSHVSPILGKHSHLSIHTQTPRTVIMTISRESDRDDILWGTRLFRCMNLWKHLQDKAPQEILVEQKLFSGCHLGWLGTQLLSWSRLTFLPKGLISWDPWRLLPRIDILRHSVLQDDKSSTVFTWFHWDFFHCIVYFF